MMLKVIAHIHTTCSYDGKWEFDKLVKYFEGQGCHVLLMTEHDKGFTQEKFEEYINMCHQASHENFLVIPGIEYGDKDNRVHILTWGEVPFLGENQETIDVLKAVKKFDVISVMAHPSRRDAWKCYNPEWSSYLSGIELWNRKEDGFKPSEVGGDLLSRNLHIKPYVVLDFHGPKQIFPLYLKMPRPSSFDVESILSQLKQGNFEPCFWKFPAGWCQSGLGLRTLKVLDYMRKKILKLKRELL
jgi:hypothetical protein